MKKKNDSAVKMYINKIKHVLATIRSFSTTNVKTISQGKLCGKYTFVRFEFLTLVLRKIRIF